MTGIFWFLKSETLKNFLKRKFLTLRRLGVNISCIDDSSFLKCTFRIRYQRSLKFFNEIKKLVTFGQRNFEKNVKIFLDRIVQTIVTDQAESPWQIFTGQIFFVPQYFWTNWISPNNICWKWQGLINEVRKMDTLSLGGVQTSVFWHELDTFLIKSLKLTGRSRSKWY